METSLERLALVEIRLAIEDLNGDFCHYLDNNMIDELVGLFTEDARYSHGPRVSCGRDQIRKLFMGRTTERVRTSRHIQTGIKVTLLSPDRAIGKSVCLTFAFDGPPPVSPATPYLVADFIDEYCFCEDCRWRIQKRHIERIFLASDNTGPEGLETTGS